MLRVSPSLLSCDFSRLGEEVARAAAAGADELHIDVMDGVFVPNITVGPCVIAAISRRTALPLDVHLMITNPGRYIGAFADAGSDILTIHAESADPASITAALREIRARGMRAGLALNPETPADMLPPFLPLLDRVLVMSVHPGFGGQAFLPQALPKISACRESIDESGLPVELSVDGGITLENAGEVAAAGASVVAAGSTVFRAADMAGAIAALRRAGQ